MFRFTQEPSSGSKSQCLAKITGMVPLCSSICARYIYRHNTDNAHIEEHSGTILVILVRHWLWLPDDGSCVNLNMLEHLLHFKRVFNNSTIYIIECISWTIKYLISVGYFDSYMSGYSRLVPLTGFGRNDRPGAKVEQNGLLHHHGFRVWRKL